MLVCHYRQPIRYWLFALRFCRQTMFMTVSFLTTTITYDESVTIDVDRPLYAPCVCPCVFCKVYPRYLKLFDSLSPSPLSLFPFPPPFLSFPSLPLSLSSLFLPSPPLSSLVSPLCFKSLYLLLLKIIFKFSTLRIKFLFFKNLEKILNIPQNFYYSLYNIKYLSNFTLGSIHESM